MTRHITAKAASERSQFWVESPRYVSATLLHTVLLFSFEMQCVFMLSLLTGRENS